MDNVISDNIFEDLKHQILDENRWDKNKFSVFSYEAGLGKSINSQYFLALSTERALYVQRFVKDGALDETVKRINDFAGDKVAVRLAEEEITNAKARKETKNKRVLCITHQLYYSICKGAHKDLIEDRAILVIDEFPDLLEQITVSHKEIGLLYSMLYPYGYKETDELANIFRDMIKKYNLKITNNKEFNYIQFKDAKYDKYKVVIKELLKMAEQIRKTELKELLFKFHSVLNNGCFFYEESFNTINSTIDFVMLRNNIILDANSDFNYIYNLSNKFDVIRQPKFYDNTLANFYHYDINTSKKGLKNYRNLATEALKKIDFKDCSGILFITEKSQKTKIEEEIQNFFNISIDETEEELPFPIKVDYFGNLIGRNNYRLYNNVVILKTPNYAYESYVLTNFLYKHMEGQNMVNVPLFQDEVIENIRISSIAGEIYQAIRRISRNNPGNAKIHVFNNNQDVIDMIVKQLPGIQYHKCNIEAHQLVNNKKPNKNDKKVKDKTLFDERVDMVKKILLDLKQSDIQYVKKKELRNELGIKDNANFSKVLIALYPFLHANNIINKGQKLIFN